MKKSDIFWIIIGLMFCFLGLYYINTRPYDINKSDKLIDVLALIYTFLSSGAIIIIVTINSVYYINKYINSIGKKQKD